MAYGRITYNGINIDLNKGFNQFQVHKIANSVISRAQSGVSQIVNFYEQEFLEILINTLDPQLQCELDEFFEYVLSGNTFSLEFNRDMVLYLPFENSINNKYDGTTGTWTKTAVTDASSYIDSNGLIKFQNTSDTPRFQAGKYGKGLLIEVASTNLCTRSETIGGTGWGSADATITEDTDETLDPFGISGTATKIEATANDGGVAFSTSTVPGTSDMSFSCWLKGVQDGITVTMNINSGAFVVTEQKTLTTEWARYSFNHTSTGNRTVAMGIQLTIDNSGDIIYAHAAQAELKNFATSYIRADSGSTVTRNADVFDGFDVSSIFNPDYGTISFWVKPLADLDNVGAQETWFRVDENGTTSRVVQLALQTNGNLVLNFDNSVNTTIAQAFVAASTYLTQGSWSHIVITYDNRVDDSVDFYIDGTLRVSSTNTSGFNPPAIGNLYIGNRSGSSEIANIEIDDFFISRDVKDATWLNNTYNRRNGLGIRRGKWPTIQLSDFANKPNWIPGDKYNYPLMIEEVIT